MLLSVPACIIVLLLLALSLNVKLFLWKIFQAIISYLILDIISLILLVTIIVILLAKNKAIKIVR